MTLKKILFATLVAVSVVALTASDSFAFGHRWGGGCWGGGCWGGSSWGSSGCWGGYSSCGSWGGRGCWGGWGSRGCWGGYSSCGCWGGYTSYSSCGCWGGYTTVSYGCSDCGTTCDGCSASNGVVVDGYASTQSASTSVVAATPAVRTRLTLRVPADAKVTLAGVETKQTGEVRQFATSKLASGQVWDGYKVVIETTRDGKTVRQERTLTLTGGQDQELAVNFNSDSTHQVAQLTR